eukprot:Skav218550  [mRNA]  locus=scaffold2599:81412:91784:- [translate_table: standard]
MVLNVAVAIAVLLCLQQRPMSKNRRSLRACDEVKFGGHDFCEAKKLLPAGNCFFQEVQSQIKWLWMEMVSLFKWLRSFWIPVLGISAAMIPVAYIVYMQLRTTEATYTLLHQVAGDQLGDISQFELRVSILYMTTLWLFDMVSDVYVVVVYLKQGMYIFGALLISIWLLSGGLAFVHRYVSWELCDGDMNIDYWAAGLNDRGERRPGFKAATLYVLQVQPILMACGAWQNGCTTELDEEKVIAALCEGFPSSLLQLYALLVVKPDGNPWILSASIASSLHTLADGVNKAYGLCQQGHKAVPGLLPKVGLITFRFCDVLARLGVWALMGRCLRPDGAQVHGLHQPYLPFIMFAELVITMIAFKVTFHLRVSELVKKYNFLGIIGSFLGMFWCCYPYPVDLVTQQRFSRSLVALRAVEAVAVLWSTAVLFLGSVGEECIVTANPAVVTMCILTTLAWSFAVSIAMAHDVSLSCFAKPWFPVIEGWRGGEVELAARVGLDSRVHSLMAALNSEAEESHDILGEALCQAAAAGHANVLIAMKAKAAVLTMKAIEHVEAGWCTWLPSLYRVSGGKGSEEGKVPRNRFPSTAGAKKIQMASVSNFGLDILELETDGTAQMKCRSATSAFLTQELPGRTLIIPADGSAETAHCVFPAGLSFTPFHVLRKLGDLSVGRTFEIIIGGREFIGTVLREIEGLISPNSSDETLDRPVVMRPTTATESGTQQVKENVLMSSLGDQDPGVVSEVTLKKVPPEEEESFGPDGGSDSKRAMKAEKCRADMAALTRDFELRRESRRDSACGLRCELQADALDHEVTMLGILHLEEANGLRQPNSVKKFRTCAPTMALCHKERCTSK